MRRPPGDLCPRLTTQRLPRLLHVAVTTGNFASLGANYPSWSFIPPCISRPSRSVTVPTQFPCMVLRNPCTSGRILSRTHKRSNTSRFVHRKLTSKSGYSRCCSNSPSPIMLRVDLFPLLRSIRTPGLLTAYIRTEPNHHQRGRRRLRSAASSLSKGADPAYHVRHLRYSRFITIIKQPRLRYPSNRLIRFSGPRLFRFHRLHAPLFGTGQFVG